MDPAPQHLAAVDDATVRLLTTLERLDDDDLRAPSLLPGWTRGHVVTHVARNADALRNLLAWARTGEPTPAYASQEERDAAIGAGAGRSAAALVVDVAATADALRADALALPAQAWTRPVQLFDRPPFPASGVLLRRLVEVELHHVDLGVGATAADWPPSFTGLGLPEPMSGWRAERLTWPAAGRPPSRGTGSSRG